VGLDQADNPLLSGVLFSLLDNFQPGRRCGYCQQHNFRDFQSVSFTLFFLRKLALARRRLKMFNSLISFFKELNSPALV
jgi:hypothetical protein